MLMTNNRTIRSHSTQACDLQNWSKDRILSVLELAHMWGFERIKKMLVDLLDAIFEVGKPLFDDDVVEEILVLHKYGLQSRYLNTYARLVKRDRPISLREAEKLGLSFSLQISNIRESIWAHKAKIYKVRLDALGKGNS